MQSYRRPIRKNKYRGHILIQLLEQRKAVPSKLKMLDFQREMLVGESLAVPSQIIEKLPHKYDEAFIFIQEFLKILAPEI